MGIRLPSCYLHNSGILLHYQTTNKIFNVMKKISLILAAMVLFAGVSFAQDKAPAKTDKTTKTEKKGGKMEKKGGKKAAKATTTAPAAK
jgi:hypothetical protein